MKNYKLMTKNEVVARFMGMRVHQSKDNWWIGYAFNPIYSKHGKEWTCGGSTKESVEQVLKTYENRFDSDRNWLHEAWVKFRDLKFETTGSMHNDYDRKVTFNVFCSNICNAITHGTITEAFDELVKGIEWYQSLQKDDKCNCFDKLECMKYGCQKVCTNSPVEEKTYTREEFETIAQLYGDYREREGKKGAATMTFGKWFELNVKLWI